MTRESPLAACSLAARIAARGPLLMGILNVTPDSFSDGGRFDAPSAARAHAETMMAEGADILDVGGESTRPGHAPVSAEDEQTRVLPVLAAITALASSRDVPISIDTYKATTARAALTAGASIVNDIWGLQRDPDIASVAATFGAPVIAMHNRQAVDPAIDIVDDMRRFFERSIAIARQAGIDDADIVLDPGIGFGKTPEQNMQALHGLSKIRSMGYPVLVGASRKSFIGALIDRPATERLNGTLAAHLFAVARGADILRVHDVRAHAEAIRVWRALETAEDKIAAHPRS
ncbi:dihydropteroate synthase [Pseudochelatococcus contaminans]|uniref:Dihydropteroate synthase n=1 Tax=Pseudochelatococcus contaminans TaxID=1538103 RepID=A0A7W6EGY2_9HYPH|nr:dihydropteroate synthase [Pseudochelatococcus contaminans]MBB3809332.1 dihydropteroate synthase [Pseudochelatococcus contaminans]